MEDTISRSDPRAIVRAFFEAVDRECLSKAIDNYCAPDFIWWTPGIGDIQNKIREIDRIMLDAIDERGISVVIHSMVAEDDKVSAEVESKATLKSGVIYNNNYHFLIKVSGRKIVSVKEYLDTKHVAEVWEDYFRNL
jgi:ketosteroid isomerase-like protein